MMTNPRRALPSLLFALAMHSSSAAYGQEKSSAPLPSGEAKEAATTADAAEATKTSPEPEAPPPDAKPTLTPVAVAPPAEAPASPPAAEPPTKEAPPAAEPPTKETPSDPQASLRPFSLNADGADIRVKPVAEFGQIVVFSHRYQGGEDGTDFNLRRDGGQGSASFTWRASAELELFRRHEFILLYQPIDLRTRATLTEDLRVNGMTFAAGTPMQFRYGFDFYRLSYLYDFLPEADQELAAGLSLQLRVADIEFASLDGEQQRTSQNLGPVPLVKLRGRRTFANEVFIGAELDGIGIKVPTDQGSLLGLFFDTSLRVGYSPTQFLETFLNVRYVGGGARGPGSKPLSPEFGDGYVNNFIHALTLTVGFAVK